MRYKVLALLALTAVVAIGCKKQPGSATNTSGDILVGEYASMTGGTATFGQSSHKGLMLALEEINKQGVLGRKIKVITEDDASNSDQAVTAVSKLVNSDKVVAVIGEVASKRSLSGAGVCDAAHIPMLSPASTNPDVTRVGPYIFRICFTDDFQGKIGADFARYQKWNKVAILTDVANDYSRGLAKAFKENFPKSGIVSEESFKEGDKNFESQLNKIKQAGPDAVYLPSYYTEVGLIVTQARRLGLNVPFFGGDGWDSSTTLANPDCNGCYYSDHYSADAPDPETRKFVDAYKAKYGETPDAMAVLGYDAMGIMAKAIQNAGKAEPQAIRDALANIRNYPGASGTITIDANRNASKTCVVLKIENGKAVIAKTFEPGK